MNKEEQKIVPELRFPEFKDSKGWKKKPFSKLFKIGSGRDYKHLEKGEIPVYGTGGYMLSVNDCLHDGKSACIGRKGTINKPIFLTGKFWTVDTLFYTHSFKDCTPEFIYLLFQNINWLNYNEAGGVPSLSKVIINKIEVFVPEPDEQDKIVQVITSLDNLISAETKKLDHLIDHKKGLLQQLFPASGETKPQFRFPEFENDGDWNSQQLGEFADVSKLAGYEFTKHIVYENKGKIIALRGLNIKNNKLDLTDVKYIDNSELSKLSRSKLFVDDLMFTYIGTIGEVALIKENNKYYLAPNVSRIRLEKGKVIPNFILQYFNTVFFKKVEVAKYISSSSQPALTMGNVRKFSVNLPPSKEEQQKIANCLSAADELIEAQTSKIEALKDHKKGLMQQLFPNV